MEQIPNLAARWLLLLLLVIAALAIVLIPAWIIQPFRPQTARGVELSYHLKIWAPALSVLVAVVAVGLAFHLWNARPGVARRIVLIVLLAPVFAAVWFARENHFEWMFNPLPNMKYARVSEANFMNDKDMVMAIALGGEAIAFPVRQMAYHHVANDVVGGKPITATYCTLCHTGLVWEAQIDGKPLTFHLAGINNQNFIMRDEQTGSWWQQVSGEAIHGPMKGKRLNPVFVDEVSFAVWKREQPQGRVLRPDKETQTQYAQANWDERMNSTPVVTQADPNDRLPQRALIIGVTVNGQSKAYPMDDLQKQRLIVDEVGGTPLALVLGEDGKSVRAFNRRLEGKTLELFAKTDAQPVQIVDAETATTWDFAGGGISGGLIGKQLNRVAVLKDYWFDWKIYHPQTAVYTLGKRVDP
jgi:Protein of unknown function (DUF3179)